MRAIKIDPVEKTVSEIELAVDPNKSLDELYRLIGCDLVQLVQLDRGIVLVCDEEARLKPIRGAFTFHGSGMVIAGTAIVLGGSGNRFKPLREGKRTFDLITAWMPPGEVPPPRMTVVSVGGGDVQ